MATEYLQQNKSIMKDYRINNPFSSKNKNLCSLNLLPKSPVKYEKELKILKSKSEMDISDWESSFKNYNKEILNNRVKQEQVQNDQNINNNRGTLISVEKHSNQDIEINDKKLYNDVKTLEKLKKKLAEKKIEYNKLIHSANASTQFKNDKETLYTETTVRFILQILGILIACGLTYKVSNE